MRVGPWKNSLFFGSGAETAAYAVMDQSVNDGRRLGHVSEDHGSHCTGGDTQRGLQGSTTGGMYPVVQVEHTGVVASGQMDAEIQATESPQSRGDSVSGKGGP